MTLGSPLRGTEMPDMAISGISDFFPPIYRADDMACLVLSQARMCPQTHAPLCFDRQGEAPPIIHLGLLCRVCNPELILNVPRKAGEDARMNKAVSTLLSVRS